MKSGFLDKLIDRVDRVEPGEVQNFLIRLSQEKGFLEQVFEALQEGVIVVDPAGLVTYVNGSTCRLFGVPEPGASIGEPLEKTILGLRWDTFAMPLESGRVVSRDLEIFYPENRFLNFYIAPVMAAETETPDSAPSSTPLAFVMLARDITNSRRAEEEKIESERLNALTLLAAGVAHELGNPLNSLNIHLQLMRRKLKKLELSQSAGEEMIDMLEVAEGEISRLDFIIKQFLGAVRPTRPNLVPVQLNDIIRQSTEFLEAELKDRKIGFTLELHGALPELSLDADQLKQALYNVIRNASQAMGGGGHLTIRSDMDDYEVRIHFTDTGSGMSAEDLGAAFEPFHTTKGTGTGLGLLIVRRIVREHGGEIEIDSVEDRGTEVTIHLPRVDKRMRFLEPGADDIPTEAHETKR